MVPKAFSRVPQALVSVSVISPRYPAGMYIPWWSPPLLRQDWSLLSVQKKYIQVGQIMTLYLKLALNSICELRLRTITLICYVGRSKRAWHCVPPAGRFWLLGTPSFFGIVMLYYYLIWRHSSHPSLSFLLQKKDQMLAAWTVKQI